MNPIISCFNKYAVFSGRASRKEYWSFTLFMFIMNVVLAMIDEQMNLDYDLLGTIFTFVTFLPMIAVACRRLHDVNKSGWFQLIPIYNLILWLKKGDTATNRFGDAV